ncbi:MAG: hypothetical protein NVS4B8_21680 [Herpetosiphon sp.]
MPSLNERIGELVKRKRQRDRLTQSELGNRIGVSGSYIGSIESGQTSPRVSEIEALAAVFRTSAFNLISEAVQPDKNTFSPVNLERNAFLALFDALTQDNQEMARLFLLFLRDQQDAAKTAAP